MVGMFVCLSVNRVMLSGEPINFCITAGRSGLLSTRRIAYVMVCLRG